MVTMKVRTWRHEIVTYYLATREMAEEWCRTIFSCYRPIITDGIQLDLFHEKLILGTPSNDQEPK